MKNILFLLLMVSLVGCAEESSDSGTVNTELLSPDSMTSSQDVADEEEPGEETPVAKPEDGGVQDAGNSAPDAEDEPGDAQTNPAEEDTAIAADIVEDEDDSSAGDVTMEEDVQGLFDAASVGDSTVFDDASASEDTADISELQPTPDALVDADEQADGIPEVDVDEAWDASVDTEEADTAEEVDVVEEADAEEEADVLWEEDTVGEADVVEESDGVEPQSSACEEACPEGTYCTNGTCSTAICGVEGFDSVVTENAAGLASALLVSQLPDLSWAPSQIYTWPDLLQGLATSCNPGFAGFSFWTGGADTSADNQAKVTLINLAAFLAQSMKETIQYDACDENNWDNTNGYKISNSCGQLGQNYEEYDCAMACPKDPSMQMTAVTNAKWYGAPGPMFCAPDSVLIADGKSTDGTTGYWNYNTDCWPYPATEPGFLPLDIDAWLRPDCQVYPGQKGGQWVWDGSGGSVEGCCWWGRGVIQTTGRCNFGTLNHYLGQSHLDSGAFPAPTSVPYPDVDFCANPNVICESAEYPELKWIAGLFYWMSSVQEYDVDGWDYEAELQAYIDGGLNGYAFIDAVSGIVNRGCHNPPCATGPVDGLDDRRANFMKALTAMGLL